MRELGILCDIYRASGCKGGTLADKKAVTLLLEHRGVFDPDESAPAVRLVTRHLFGRDYTHAEPVAPVPEGRAGYMAGGTFIFSHDARFGHAAQNGGYPVSLHDNTETISMAQSMD